MTADNKTEETNHIPDHIVGPERTMLQMFRLFVEPEVKRRQAAGSLPLHAIVIKTQVLFFEGKSPEVRINDEVRISLLVRTPRSIEKGEAISLSEIEGFETSELDLADADAGHFTAVAFDNQWLMSFDFRRNKLKASTLLGRAAQFCDVAEHALTQGHFGPAIDNLFSACELTAKARLITSAAMNSDTKTHGQIQSRINMQGKIGNVDREFVDMFNKLGRDRETARYSPRKDDLSALIDEMMVAKARAEISELTKRTARFSDDP